MFINNILWIHKRELLLQNSNKILLKKRNNSKTMKDFQKKHIEGLVNNCMNMVNKRTSISILIQ